MISTLAEDELLHVLLSIKFVLFIYLQIHTFYKRKAYKKMRLKWRKS